MMKPMLRSWSFERKIYLGFFLLLVAALISRWYSISSMQRIIADKNQLIGDHANALLEAGRLRYFAEAKVSDGRAYFLFGEKSYLEDSRKNRLLFRKKLAEMLSEAAPGEKRNRLEEIARLEEQHEKVLEQALRLYERNPNPKTVEDILISRAVPIRTKLDNALDEVVHQDSRELTQAKAESASLEIRRTHSELITAIASFLFASLLMLLMLRMLKIRGREQVERERLYEEAKKAVQARDDVLAFVSHDLKNPLSAIELNAALLLKSGKAAAADNVLVIKGAANIQKSARTMKELTQGILDHAKIAAGRMELDLEEKEINEVLADSWTMLEPLADQKSIALTVELPNPPIRALCDGSRLMEVLSNLVGNAIKFTPKNGRIRICARREIDAVILSVSDTGPGISEEHIPYLFDRYWQARETAQQGTGLGLAIVKGLVEAHGGKVWVESRLGMGSTFYFSLPQPVRHKSAS